MGRKSTRNRTLSWSYLMRVCVCVCVCAGSRLLRSCRLIPSCQFGDKPRTQHIRTPMMDRAHLPAHRHKRKRKHDKQTSRKTEMNQESTTTCSEKRNLKSKLEATFWQKNHHPENTFCPFPHNTVYTCMECSDLLNLYM